MSILELINQGKEFANEYGVLMCIVILCMLSLVQIVPIKLNPWSAIAKCFRWMFRSIGSWMTADIREEIHNIDAKVDKLSEVIDDNETDRIRSDILEFASSCQRGVNHTQNEFLRMFKLNKKYHDILERIHHTNGEIDREINFLEELYARKEREDSFLK